MKEVRTIPDTLNIFGTEYSNVAGIIAKDDNETDQTYIKPQGTKSITANGNGIDVAAFASVDVNVPAPTPSLQNKTAHAASSQQQVTADNGYAGLGTVTIPGVTTSNLTAENVKSGVVVTVGDADDADRIASVTGSYSGGGSSKNIQAYIGSASRTANSYGATSITLTVAKTGTYKVSWVAWRGSSQGTMGTNLYKNDSPGTNQQTWTGTYGQCITLSNQSYNQGDVLTLYATSGSTTRSVYVANLIIEEE